jgi:hypothetical protein
VTAVGYPLSAVRYPLSAIRHPPSAARFPLFRSPLAPQPVHNSNRRVGIRHRSSALEKFRFS